MVGSPGPVGKPNWNDPPLPASLKVRRLRLELGQTQQQVVDRARRDPRVSPTFAQSDVGKAEMREAHGLSAERVRLGIASGLGVRLADFDAYVEGRLSLSEAVDRSEIRPDPGKVAKMKESATRRLTTQNRFSNLYATLKWRSDYDPTFLDAYETWALSLGKDYPRDVWGVHIMAQFARWQRGRPFEPPDVGTPRSSSHPHAGDDDVPRGRRR
jgi:hypothetical protein